MLCPRLPKSGVNPYTLYPYTPVYPYACPLTHRGASWGLGRTPRGGGHEEALSYACYHDLSFLPSYVHSMYVAKGGRRRPGGISRLATPPGSQVGPCRPAFTSAPWGENLSRPQPCRSGTAARSRRGGPPLISSTDPPGVGQIAVRSVRSQWCGATVGCPHAPHAASPPPTLPPAHPPTATALPQRMGMPMAEPVPVGWGGVVGAHECWTPPGWGGTGGQ